MSSSEEILIQVGQVRCKKNDGTLYMMSQRLAWIIDNKDTVSISHKYADIKMQKISSEGKPKVQLQVVLHDNSTTTFQFVSKQGQQAAIKDRDKVKDLLIEFIPKFKKKVNKELEEKNKTLKENPELLQLYKDLVITKVIDSDEFWKHHAPKYMQENKLQQIGVSGAFLADIKPQADGCNGLKYNLTPEIMEAIFKTYPAVKAKHTQVVPQKLSEAQFWTKFFQSHYFHRDRIDTGSKDLFTDCAKVDEQIINTELSKGNVDPLVDVTRFEDKTVDECYGSGLSIGTSTTSSSQNIIHQSMIKRFNQHSIMVLRACAVNSTLVEDIKLGSEEEQISAEYIASKKRRIEEAIIYEDLEEEVNIKEKSKSPSKLNLDKVERYLQGPSKDSNTHIPTNNFNDPLEALKVLRREVTMWGRQQRNNNNLLAPSNAVAALGELTPGGALMIRNHIGEESLSGLVNDNLSADLSQLYRGASELLRHFWACFPPTTPELREKLEKMHEALSKFHTVRLRPFEQKVMCDHTHLGQALTKHLNHMMTAAYTKYQVWQSRAPRIPSSI